MAEISVWEVSLGALLHDIGKLVQRAGRGKKFSENVRKRQGDILPSYQGILSHWHALWSDEFFEWADKIGWPKYINQEAVRDIAVYHHKPLQQNAYTYLTTAADRAASGYERKQNDEDDEKSEKTSRNKFRQTAMDAIQARIEISDKNKKNGKFITKEFGPETLMPHEQIEGNDVEKGYKELWESFQEGWKKLCENADNADPETFFEGVLSLMERFCWCVPSSTMDQPDVSLFEHSKAVSAFAATLYKWHVSNKIEISEDILSDYKTNKFRFLVGDLSGLQDTLFRLKSEQIKGLNKILRGRSLRFQLIAEMAIRRVLREFVLPQSCVLQNAGGRFLILLPDLPDKQTDSTIDSLRSEFDKWLAKQYYGDLGLGLALSDGFAFGDFVTQKNDKDKDDVVNRIEMVRTGLRRAIEIAKLKQLQKPLIDSVSNVHFESGACSACGVRPAYENENSRCWACESEYGYGNIFPKANSVLINIPKKSSEPKQEHEIFGGSCKLSNQNNVVAPQASSGWRFGDEGETPFPIKRNKPYVPKFSADYENYKNLEDYDDIKSGDIKTFAALAEDSRENINGKLAGRPMLAVLKADVDNLGLIFLHGLGEKWSIARQSALSHLLDGYFTIHLPYLLENDYPNIYTVYAGGDDLFLLGPWLDIFRFASFLHEDFSKFSLNNPDLTISAGIALFDPKTPISIPAREAEKRLERAKEGGRNKISAIEADPMGWEEYKSAIDNGKKINQCIRDGKISSAALYKFLYFDDARHRIKNKKVINKSDYAWKARLNYHLARMVEGVKCKEIKEEINNMFLKMFGFEPDSDNWGSEKFKIGVRLAISLALYRNR